MPPDDDPDVKAFFRRDDPSAMDPQDAAVMRAAADVLRDMNSDRPPMASLELTALMTQGMTRSNPMKTHTRAMLTRFAGLGAAAKLLLATGVAVAGVGSAATAVAFTTGHLDDSHHHGVAHVRHRDNHSPDPAESAEHHRGDAAHTPGADDASPEPRESAEPEPSDSPGHHHDHDGEQRTSGRSPGGPPSATAGDNDGHGDDGNRSPGGPPTPAPSSTASDGNGSPGGPPTATPSNGSGRGGPGSGDNGHGDGGDNDGSGSHGGGGDNGSDG